MRSVPGPAAHSDSKSLRSQAATRCERSSEGAKECSPQPALSEAEGVQAVGKRNDESTSTVGAKEKERNPLGIRARLRSCRDPSTAVSLCARRAKAKPRSG
jgi:hypothetical protein